MINIHKHLTPDDFVIILRPVKGQVEVPEEEEEEEVNEREGWTGEVQVSIITNAHQTTLSDSEFVNMVMLCNFAAASIPAMEENAFLRDMIRTYVQKSMIIPTPENQENIILSFDSNTKGTA
jgi:hypothetical protein